MSKEGTRSAKIWRMVKVLENKKANVGALAD
jgi:hypothetical protein